MVDLIIIRFKGIKLFSVHIKFFLFQYSLQFLNVSMIQSLCVCFKFNNLFIFIN